MRIDRSMHERSPLWAKQCRSGPTPRSTESGACPAPPRQPFGPGRPGPCVVPAAAASGGVGAGSLLHSPFYSSSVNVGAPPNGPFGAIKLQPRPDDADVFFETVLSWAEYVVCSMAEHKWKHVGYDAGDNGRPLFEMRNPNEFYDEATKKYVAVVYLSLCM